MAQSKKGGPALMNVRVREAVIQDIQRITEIHNQAIVDRESLLDITPHPLKERLSWFKNLSSREAVVVAEIKNNVVGFCALQPWSLAEEYAHIGIPTVWIEKDFRAQGIGQKLARKINALARKRGYRKLMFFAYSFDREKMRYFRELGYQEVGIFKRHAKIKGKYVDVLTMERFL
jgi:phosphinothricin acetyltransferase